MARAPYSRLPTDGPSMHEHISKFLECVDWSLLQRADFAIVGVRQSDGVYPLGGRIVLNDGVHPPAERVSSISDHFCVSVGSCRSNDIRDDLTSKVVEDFGFRSLGLAFAGERWGHLPSWSAILQFDFGRRHIGWPARTLRLGLPSRASILQAAHGGHPTDEQFASLRPVPFASCGDALLFVGVERDLNLASGLDIIATTPARIHDVGVRLDTAVATTTVETTLDPSQGEMSVLYSSRQANVRPIEVKAREWKRVDAERWIAQAQLTPGTSWTAATLLVHGLSVETIDTFAPSSPVYAHAQLEESDIWLERLLFAREGKTRAESFERGVVALLSLAQLPTIPYGHEGRDRYFDFLAFAGSNSMVVGECTTEVPGEPKLTKLAARAAELSKKFAHATRECIVCPAVFLPLGQDSLPEEVIAIAKRLRVSLIFGDRLRELLSVVHAGVPPRQLFDLIRRHSL